MKNCVGVANGIASKKTDGSIRIVPARTTLHARARAKVALEACSPAHVKSDRRAFTRNKKRARAVAVDASGQVVIRRQLKRRYLQTFFQKLPSRLVGIDLRLWSPSGTMGYWLLDARGYDVYRTTSVLTNGRNSFFIFSTHGSFARFFNSAKVRPAKRPSLVAVELSSSAWSVRPASNAVNQRRKRAS